MKEKTETIFCESFMELLRKNSFQKITIQMIANKCGVNRQTFYYHYENIYDLLAHTMEYHFVKESRFKDIMSWEESVELLLSWMIDNKGIIRNIVGNVNRMALRKGIYPIVQKCLSSAYYPNFIVKSSGDDSEEEFIQRFLTIGITQYIMEWVENDFKESKQEVVDHIFLILKRIYG